MIASRTRHVVCLLTTFILASCAMGPYQHVDAVIDVEDQRLLIVPLAVETSQQKMRWFESKMGIRIANAMSDVIRQNVDCTVLDPEPLRTPLRRMRFSSPDWKELARKEKADILVACRIVDYALHDPRTQGFLRGRAVVEMKVIGTEGKVLLNQTLPPIVYPKRNSQDPDFDIPGGTTLRLTPDAVRVGLEGEIIKHLAWIFHDHDIPTD